MENKKVKKVIIELEDGNKMEFEGQMAMFLEDEMSEMEKKFKGEEHGKVCGILQCNPCFLASVTNAILKELADKAPGIDLAVMMKHIENKDRRKSMMSVLEEIFG